MLQVLDRYVTLQALGPSDMCVANFYRARLEQYVVHTHGHGLTYRYVEYHDTACIRAKRVTEVFSRRKDGLFKRVRYVDLQTVEQHFERDHFGGIALIVDVLGKRQELYFYPNARVDGLLKRTHDFGVKITEYYGETPNRVWYRSISLVPTGPTYSLATTGARAADVPSALTVEVGPPRPEEVVAEEEGSGVKRPGVSTADSPIKRKKVVLVPVEQAIHKMTEKYRREPTGAIPAYNDMAKIVYLLDASSIQVDFHHAAGRITACSRLYQKPGGKFEALSVDPYAPVPRVRVLPVSLAPTACFVCHRVSLIPFLPMPVSLRSTNFVCVVLQPFDTDNEFRRLLMMEKECHAAGRARARACLEILTNRVSQDRGVVLEKTIFELALDRARTGAPLEDEPEKHGAYLDVVSRVCVCGYCMRMDLARGCSTGVCTRVGVACAASTCSSHLLFLHSSRVVPTPIPLSPLQWSLTRWTTCFPSCWPPSALTQPTQRRRRPRRQTACAASPTRSACWSELQSSRSGWRRRTTTCCGDNRHSLAIGTTQRARRRNLRGTC